MYVHGNSTQVTINCGDSVIPLDHMLPRAKEINNNSNNTKNSDNTLLAQFDNTLRAALSVILKVDLNDDQWAQASLPVRNGGLGIRSAQMLAPSAFLAAAASTLELQQSTLPPSIQTLADKSTETVELSWAALPGASKSTGKQPCIQKAWDGLVSVNQVTRILSGTSSDTDMARLLAASSPHTGDWLHAPPIASVGLRLSDEAVRIAVTHRLGCKACEPHTKQSVHEDSKVWLVAEVVRDISVDHSQLNDILWLAFKRASVPAVKESAGLSHDDGKRPGGVTLLPWAQGKPLAWDVTVPDTYSDSHLADTATTAGAAADKAASNKVAK